MEGTPCFYPILPARIWVVSNHSNKLNDMSAKNVRKPEIAGFIFEPVRNAVSRYAATALRIAMLLNMPMQAAIR